MTQPGNFSLVGEGLNVGKDPAEPVTDDYSGHAARTRSPAARSRRRSSTSRASTYVDLELEALAMMKRE